MMINEFVDLTGFKPTDDYYHTEIEPIYERSDMDKRDWCKQWKKNGGIQKAYDALREQAANDYAKVLSLENDVKKLKCMNDTQSEIIRDEREKSFVLSQALDKAKSDLNAVQEREQSMMYELLEISEKYSSAELREIVINAIGFKEYISYKFEHDMAIWQLDRDKIIENLK